jgi:RNA polymerase sigma factor (sigma-70 family)
MSTIEFNHLLATNHQYLKGFAYNFTRNPDDADDLLQDTCLKALRYKHLFADGTNFNGWLYTIMRNIFLNSCKKQQLVRNYIASETNKSTDWRSMSANNVYSQFDQKEIDSAIDSLKEDMRVPFRMMHEGYQYDEVASHLNIPTGTVKSRIFNARNKLAQALKDFN